MGYIVLDTLVGRLLINVYSPNPGSLEHITRKHMPLPPEPPAYSPIESILKVVPALAVTENSI